MNDPLVYLRLNRPIESLTVSELSKHIKTAMALQEQTIGRGDQLCRTLSDLIMRLRQDREYLEKMIARRERTKY